MDKRYEQTFYQRGYIVGRNAHENIFYFLTTREV